MWFWGHLNFLKFFLKTHISTSDKSKATAFNFNVILEWIPIFSILNRKSDLFIFCVKRVSHTKCDFEVTSIFKIFSVKLTFHHSASYKGTALDFNVILHWIPIFSILTQNSDLFVFRVKTVVIAYRMWLWGHLNFLKFFWNFFEIEFRHLSHTQGYCLGWSLWFGPDVHFLNSDPKIGFVRFSCENGRDCILNVILRSPQFFEIFSQNSHFDIWQIKGYCLQFQCDFGLNSNCSQFRTEISKLFVFRVKTVSDCILECDFEVTWIFWNFFWNFFEIEFRHLSHTQGYLLPWMITVIWAWMSNFLNSDPKTRICSFFVWKRSWLHTKCDFEVTSIFWNFFVKTHISTSRRHHKATAFNFNVILDWIPIFSILTQNSDLFVFRVKTVVIAYRMWLWGHLNFLKFFWNFFEIEFRHLSHTQGYCLGWSLWFGPDVHFLNSDPKIGFVRFSRQNGRDCILNVILRSPQFFEIFSQNSHFDIWQIKGYCLGFQCDFGLNSNFLNFEPKIRFVRFLREKGQYCILNVILRSPQFFKFFRETHISPFGIIQGYCLGFQCDFALNSNSLNSDPKLGFVHSSRQNGRDCIQNVTLRSPQFFEIFLKFCSKLSFDIRRIHKGTALDDHCDLGLMSIF